jgi:beta-galactosidase
MKNHSRAFLTPFLFIFLAGSAACAAETAGEVAVALPPGVTAQWNLAKADRWATPTRERICINGLWRWHPARSEGDDVPTKNWGYFKVPGCWPGLTDYLQKDSQTLFAHPSWKNDSQASTTMAWYQREISIPGDWGDRRIVLSAEYVNSYAAVFVDGKKAGEIRFPGGEADLTSVCHAGKKHMLSLLVVAMPLKEVLLYYQDTNSARKLPATVPRRGLCGDVFLVSTPTEARITDFKVNTSVRWGAITFDAAIDKLPADGEFELHARLMSHGQSVREFASKPFKASDMKMGRFAFPEMWKPDKLWNIDTPENRLDVAPSLVRVGGELLDQGHSVNFGYREFWIDGRDFLLNGQRIQLSAVPLDNAEIGAATANYEAAKESFQRLKSFGVNFVYTHNYGCEPGSHLSFNEILRAADDVGMLVSMSQPHFSHYEWQKPDADQNNGYARHAEFYVRAAQNHPSVVAYSMSHNATGYDEDMNPDLIDGIHDARDRWSLNNVKLALRAEAIVKRLDPSRIVYHHASGNLGSMHDSNFYPNLAPVQELSDWFEHWATTGVKPVFTCEYGAPFTWDWGMYRGWYKGKREWGSAKVPWEFCLAEWNSQFLGDSAFRIVDAEKANLRWEAKKFRSSDGWNRWEYPQSLDSKAFDSRYAVLAMYLTDNWRSYRTWGVSAVSAWQHEFFWKLRDGVDRRRKDLKVDWERIQRPGFSPDYLDQRYERMDVAFDRADWIPTPAADAMYRNNRPLLAYIGGKAEGFTSKDHNFFPGETVKKQIIIINNSRRDETCFYEWSLSVPGAAVEGGQVEVDAGEQSRIPIEFKLSGTMPPGNYELRARVHLTPAPASSVRGADETQDDVFSIEVLPRPRAVRPGAKIALFDPKGETGQLLKRLGVRSKPVEANDDLSAFDTLVVGKSALTADGPAPSIARVRDGLRVILFEQSPQVLEQRFGFRVQQYGLRQVIPRVPDHPLLAGIGAEQLRDWRGAATILPARLEYQMRPMHGPTIEWCGIPVTQVWRCGNRGNVASVLIEKPVCGDFLPIVDGGFSLQYSPLMEYREGRGMILFCQLDVTGRTESDPAADTLVENMLRFVSTWKPSPQSVVPLPLGEGRGEGALPIAPPRHALYSGDPAGKEHLESAGVSVSPYEGGALAADQVLIVGPGGGRKLAGSAAAIADWLKSGGHLLAIGLDGPDASALPVGQVSFRNQEHVGAYFEPFHAASLLAGVGPADVYNRDPRNLPLVASGAMVFGDGVLAAIEKKNIVFCQLAPWQFDKRQYYLKKTFRRSSFLVSRLLANMGIAGSTPILSRFHTPVDAAKHEQRWLTGLYLDQPEEWDDPYRFFRW